MTRRTVIVATSVFSLVGAGVWAQTRIKGQLTPPPSAIQPLVQRAASTAVLCSHEASEDAFGRARREQALALARAINTAEGRIAERTRNYAPLAQLATLPSTPVGFQLRFLFDGTNYVFSIKDRQDACGYGVFSDQDALLYEKTPHEAKIASAPEQ
jgi:hypothetical protein